MEDFGKICFAFSLLFMSLLLGAFVFIQLYDWFIVTSFNAPPITLAKAMGINLIISFIRPQVKKEEDFSTSNLFKQFGEIIKTAVILLLAGYIVHLYI